MVNLIVVGLLAVVAGLIIRACSRRHFHDWHTGHIYEKGNF